MKRLMAAKATGGHRRLDSSSSMALPMAQPSSTTTTAALGRPSAQDGERGGEGHCREVMEREREEARLREKIDGERGWGKEKSSFC